VCRCVCVWVYVWVYVCVHVCAECSDKCVCFFVAYHDLCVVLISLNIEIARRCIYSVPYIPIGTLYTYS